MSSAVERYLAVCRPHHFRVVRILILILILILIVFAISIIIIIIVMREYPRIYKAPSNQTKMFF